MQCFLKSCDALAALGGSEKCGHCIQKDRTGESVEIRSETKAGADIVTDIATTV